ncbi:MAG TPA: IclR family transcriptional regulator [Anaerolineae bacterium]|nr:IclR family transcriptional regulator [Anaerolineae bacterium]
MTDLVPAVDRALRILNAFKNGHAEYGVTDLSRLLSINKSTVHDILHTLAHYNLLERNPVTQKYRLGPGLPEFGDLARQRRDVREVAHPFLRPLVEATGVTALLGVFEAHSITIVDKVEPPDELRITASVGQRMPFCAGSFGRAFLAWMDEASVDSLLVSPGLRKFTATSITDPSAYKASLASVRRQGYAVDDTEEYLEGVWAASAPIRDASRVVAAMTVVGFAGRIGAARKKAALRTLVQTTRRISQMLGAPATSNSPPRHKATKKT